MPAIGYTFRSVNNRFAASIDLHYYVGTYITGERSFFYRLFSLMPSIFYNISPSFAVSLNVGGFYIDPFLMASKAMIDPEY